ncbi:MAG: glycosyltransferase family 39 protein [Candidatus Zixiibacteriota bacterium]
MTTLRYAAGSLSIVVAVVALFAFDVFRELFLFLSPDHSVTSFMWQLMQICLISLGEVGAVVLLSRWLLRLAGRLDRYLVTSDKTRLLWQWLLVAFALRTFAVVVLPFNLWQDFQCYDELGWQWATDGGYYNGAHLTAYWPPGYPFWLSRIYLVFGHVPVIGAIANIFLGTATVLLSYLLVRCLWGERIGRWSLLILALFPSQVLFANVLASEMLFTPLFLLALLLFVAGSRIRHWWAVVCLGGLFLGLATLTRTISAPFLCIVALYWFLESRSWRFAAARTVLGLAGFALVVTPWIIRNHHAVGRACLSTNTGINLFIGNQPSSGMGYNHHAALQFDLWDPSKEAYVDSAASAQAWDYIREKPFAFLGRGVIKVMFFYAVDVDPLDYQLFRVAESGSGVGWLGLAVLTESWYLIVLLLAALALPVVIRSRIHRNASTALVLLTVGYWTAVHFVFFSIGRFHFPIIPILAALAAVALAYCIDTDETASASHTTGTN